MKFWCSKNMTVTNENLWVFDENLGVSNGNMGVSNELSTGVYNSTPMLMTLKYQVYMNKKMYYPIKSGILDQRLLILRFRSLIVSTAKGV